MGRKTTATEVPDSARTGGAGERKHVTILFADLAGSTKLCEGLSPEATHELINAWVQLVTAAIYAEGGIVTEFAGDAVMALFGAPVAYEDAPQRACRAGLSTQRDLQRLNEGRGTSLRMRVGIDSGECFVGDVGNELRSDYTALGHRANVAKRVQEVAEPGSVTVSEATQRLIQPYFNTVPAGELAAKGLDQPLVVHRVWSARPPRSRLDAALARREVPVVGRAEQLMRLRAVLDGLGAGSSRFMLVEGEPGIGKSRLAHELKGAAVAGGIAWWEGRASPYGEQHAYGIFADLIRRISGIQEGDPPAVARAKLIASCADRSGEAALEFVLSIAAVDSSARSLEPEALKAAIFASVARLIHAQASRQPVVLLLDDFHWTDRLSQELTGFVVEHSRDLPLLVLLLSRPTAIVDLPMLSRFERMTLNNFEAPETEALVAALLGPAAVDDPNELYSRVHRLTGGNPLFVEEVVRELVFAGVVEQRDAGWCLTIQAREFSMPGSLRDLIAARVDRLETERQRILQTAAVIGESFSRDVLAGFDAWEELDAGLEELVRHGFINAPAAASPLHFKHALTWQVVYGGLSRRERAQAHARVGALLEARFAADSETLLEDLSRHYGESDDDDKAVRYSSLAAAKAERAFANREAVQYLGRAIERSKHVLSDLERSELVTARGEIYSKLLGDYEAATADFDEAARLAAGHGGAESKALLGRAKLLMFQYRLEEALPWIERALTTARLAGERRATAEALVQKAINLGEKEAPDLDQALDCLHEALRTARDEADDRLEAHVLERLARTQYHAREVDAALTTFAQCVELCARSGDKVALSVALQNQGGAYLAQGEWQRAVDVNLHLRELLSQTGDLRHLAMSCFNLGAAWHGMGREDAAIRCYEEAAERFRQLGIHEWVKMSLRMLRLLYQQSGDKRQSVRVLEGLADLLRAEDTQEEVPQILTDLGEAYMEQGETRAAARSFAEAARIHLDRRRFADARRCLERAEEAEAGSRN